RRVPKLFVFELLQFTKTQNNPGLPSVRHLIEKRKNIGEIMKKSLLPNAESLQGYITQLRNIANEIDEIHKNAVIANVCGGSMGIVGGVAGLAGLVLTPVTFGSSLALPMAGFAVSAVGGITNAINKMGDGSDPDLPLVLQAGLGVGKAVLNAGKLLKAGKMAADAGRVAPSIARKTTSRMLASNARQAARLAGNVTRGLIGIGVLLDAAFLVNDSKELMDGAKTKLAAEIRREAAEMAEVIETVNKFHRSVSQSPGWDDLVGVGPALSRGLD
uniref:Apolipoprotein L5 n=1 Tax=Terrapene triunguis TaxID=2587831 RepID=A0A674INS7_9SAUR